MVHVEVSPDKKKLIITADLPAGPYPVSGTGRTQTVIGGAPIKTGIRVKDSKGQEAEITVGLNAYIKNPDFVDPVKAEKEAAKKAKQAKAAGAK